MIQRLVAALDGTRRENAPLLVVADERPELLTDMLSYVQARDPRTRLEESPQRRPTFDEVAPLLLTTGAGNRIFERTA